MRKPIRRFSKKPYFYAGSFKQDLNGKPLSKTTSKRIATAYASHLRQRGRNARVVNWAGGSGVYFAPRHYNKDINEARQDWLNRYKEMSKAQAEQSEVMRMLGQSLNVSAQPFFAGGQIAESSVVQKRPSQYYDKLGRPVKTLNNPGRLNELKFKILQIQSGNMSEEDLTDEEKFVLQSAAIRFGPDAAKHTFIEGIPQDRRPEEILMRDDLEQFFDSELIGDDTEFYTAPKSQQEALNRMIATRFNELDMMSDEELARNISANLKGRDVKEILEDPDLFKYLNALETSWPLVQNVLDDGDRDFAESGSSPEIAKYTTSGLTGWASEGFKGGKKGQGRFGNVSTDLVRFHVAASYPTKDGVEETPLMAFSTEEQAEEFLQSLDELGRERGEYLFARQRKKIEGEFPEFQDLDLILPYEDVSLAIVRQVADESDRRAIIGQETIDNISTLNLDNPDRKTYLDTEAAESMLPAEIREQMGMGFEGKKEVALKEMGIGQYGPLFEDGDLGVRSQYDGRMTMSSEDERDLPTRSYDEVLDSLGRELANKLLTGISAVELAEELTKMGRLPSDSQRYEANIQWARNVDDPNKIFDIGANWRWIQEGLNLIRTEDGWILKDDELAGLVANNSNLQDGVFGEWLRKKTDAEAMGFNIRERVFDEEGGFRDNADLGFGLPLPSPTLAREKIMQQLEWQKEQSDKNAIEMLGKEGISKEEAEEFLMKPLEFDEDGLPIPPRIMGPDGKGIIVLTQDWKNMLQMQVALGNVPEGLDFDQPIVNQLGEPNVAGLLESGSVSEDDIDALFESGDD